MKHHQCALSPPILQEIYWLPSMILKLPGWEACSHRGAYYHLHLNIRHAGASRSLPHRWVHRLLDRGADRVLPSIVFDGRRSAKAPAHGIAFGGSELRFRVLRVPESVQIPKPQAAQSNSKYK